MVRYVARQFLLSLAVLIAVSIVGFVLLRASGDLAQRVAGAEAQAADVARIRLAYGLDKPLPVQYLEWAQRAVTGDLGRSLFFPENVSTLIAQRLPITLGLGALGLGAALLIGLPLGTLSALKPNGWFDRVVLTVAVLGQAMPPFWLGLLLIILFGLNLGWLPVSGSSGWQNLVLPTAVLAIATMPTIMRLTRSGMIDQLRADYVRTARAKGLKPVSVIVKHALRNALIPVVAIAAVQLGALVGGSVVLETVFGIQGLGYLAWESINRADYPVVQAVVLVLGGFYCLLTFVSDLLHAFLDPRLREQ
ncbi:ABC transporter permease [Bosea caraganae]|uniref:ABC transporter permease n=1 Tax=Bosea caraganae TaxID=2763117 RepID=A0A370L958_9HYPH|nr:ABC transporter permease [Bosea caraganae]RDJ26815.1 ABC transporter permease [Bosea caraganae]RDJ30701.1 ABC transporter permease [Bosea caraganae]